MEQDAGHKALSVRSSHRPARAQTANRARPPGGLRGAQERQRGWRWAAAWWGERGGGVWCRRRGGLKPVFGVFQAVGGRGDSGKGNRLTLWCVFRKMARGPKCWECGDRKGVPESGLGQQLIIPLSSSSLYCVPGTKPSTQ